MKSVTTFALGLAVSAPLAAQDPTLEQIQESVLNSPVRVPGALHEGDTSLLVQRDPDFSGPLQVTAFFGGDDLGTFVLEPSLPEVSVPMPFPLPAAANVLLVESTSGRALLEVKAQTATFSRGDVNGTGTYGDSPPDAFDVVYLYEYLFAGGPAPTNMTAADVDGDGDVDPLDLVVLYQWLIGQPHVVVEGGVLIELTPMVDMRSDGTLMSLGTFYGPIGQSWGKSHTPPRKGEPVVEFDEDGNPATKEWKYPCTFKPADGPAGSTGLYYTFAISRGPKTPVPDKQLNGGNCVHTLYYFCIEPAPFFPFFAATRTPVGECTYESSHNISKQLQNGVIVYQCQNAEPGNDEYTNYAYNVDTGILIVQNETGQTLYQGPNSGYEWTFRQD